MEPLPEVSPADVVALLERLAGNGGEDEIFRLADRMNLEFGRMVIVTKATELLAFVETPGESVALTTQGRRFVSASEAERIRLWRDQLLTLKLFQIVHESAERRADRAVDRDFVVDTIVTRMPHENYGQVFNTLVRWARFGQLFEYDTETQRLALMTGPRHE
jgi:NitT/TauT family transport system ATP-binding protein